MWQGNNPKMCQVCFALKNIEISRYMTIAFSSSGKKRQPTFAVSFVLTKCKFVLTIKHMVLEHNKMNKMTFNN